MAYSSMLPSVFLQTSVVGDDIGEARRTKL
jgi:hypothetical protein